jgi:hypothetical protein
MYERCTKNIHITYLVHELDESKKMKSRKRLFLTLVLFDKKNFKENWHPMFKIMFPLKRKKFSGYLILYASKRKRKLEGKPHTQKAS